MPEEIEVSELEMMDVFQVDLVGKAANRRKWLLLKSDDELPDDVLDALEKEESLDEAAQKVRDAFRKQFPAQEIAIPSNPSSGYVDVVYPDHIILSAGGETFSIGYSIDANGNLVFMPQSEWQKVKREVNYVAAKEDSTDNGMPVDNPIVEQSKQEGGDTEMSSEELKKAQDELVALQKQMADQADALKKAEADNVELAKAAEAKETIIKEQKKAARLVETADLCKAASLDFEALYKAEQADPDNAKALLDVVENLVKQVNALMGQEQGTAKVGSAPDLETLTKAYAAENKVDFRTALLEVSKAHPELKP